MQRKWIGVKQLSRELKVSARTLRRWEQKGILPPANRVRKELRWRREEVDRAIRDHDLL